MTTTDVTIIDWLRLSIPHMDPSHVCAGSDLGEGCCNDLLEQYRDCAPAVAVSLIPTDWGLAAHPGVIAGTARVIPLATGSAP